ncbi:MAG: hypothetical protein Q9188_006382, partial [Gyalolechia gomerana]
MTTYGTLNIFRLSCVLSSILCFCSAFLSPQSNCTTCLPNPLARTFPYNVTGTINGTTSVLLVPIPYAQSLLPTRFSKSILTHAYTRFNIPPSAYPIVIEATIDHDIRFNNSVALADFSSLRLTFPFVDLLGDGYSNFRYTSYIYLPSSIPAAIRGAEAYGITVIPAFFDPPDAPYTLTPNSKGKVFSFEVYSNTSSSCHNHKNQIVASLNFHSSTTISPFPLSFYKNVTNQPMFGNNINVCDNMLALWNTSTSTGEYAPQGV